MAYNGWTNYETWAVALWISNEEGSYRATQEQAQQALADADDDTDDATAALADALKEEYAEALSGILDAAKISASVWADLFGAALAEVNWHEIAANLVLDATAA